MQKQLHRRQTPVPKPLKIVARIIEVIATSLFEFHLLDPRKKMGQSLEPHPKKGLVLSKHEPRRAIAPHPKQFPHADHNSHKSQ